MMPKLLACLLDVLIEMPEDVLSNVAADAILDVAPVR